MKPIAIFYHCLFFLPEFRLKAYEIVADQVRQFTNSGLMTAAKHIQVGINGGDESLEIARLVFPDRTLFILHGLESKAENLTITTLHKWAQSHPGWNIFYGHAKGSSHMPDSSYGNTVSGPWRHAMMQDLVMGWRECVRALDDGADVACSHWMWNMADGTQHIPAGNFLWVKSEFAAALPSMFLRDRIKVSGISSLESRYEAEVFWGNGKRPSVYQVRPNGGGGVP